jgi:putative aldouronate transport system permease protein
VVTASAPNAAVNRKSLWSRILQHKILYLFILPCVVWLIVFCYVPMYGIVLAFKNYNYSLGILGSPWAGLKWFQKFLSSPEFWIVTKNTLIISGLKLVVCFPAPIILALLFNEVDNMRFKRVIQTVSYLPNFVSWVVVVALLTIIFSPYGGIVNNIRANFGQEAVFYMGEKDSFYPMVVFSDMWKNAGWGSIIYLSALSAVSADLYEAARIDGAGRWKSLLYVTLPGISETIAIMFIFQIGNILNAGFDQILLLQQPANNTISEILDTFILKTGLNYGRFEYATAIGLFRSLFALMMMALANLVSRRTLGTGIW